MELLICEKRAAIVAILAMAGLMVGGGVAAEPKGAAPQDKPAAETGEPRLELTISGPQTAVVGSRVAFELEVTNAGRTTAANLLMVDDFQPGLEHDAAASPIEHDLKDLRPGESQRLGLTFRVTRPGKLTHRIRITQQGKEITVARSSVFAAEPAGSTPTGKPAAGMPEAKSVPDDKRPVGEAAKKPEKAKASDDSDFPEITPRPDTPKVDKIPDLGPPLVDRPQDLKRLNEKYPVWIDRAQRRVVLVGSVCQRQAPLELFACLRGSKEHEAVLSIPTKAAFVHAALLAVGAEPGSPVQFRPKYVPASGSEIEITCVWNDAQGKRQTARAQDWVRNVKTGKSMEYPWVFGGSRFRKDPGTGESYYQADSDGDLICVSNFPGAMLDLPIQSTSSDTQLLFEGFAERIPPRETPVTLILAPKPNKPAATGATGEIAPPAKDAKTQPPPTKPAKP